MNNTKLILDYINLGSTIFGTPWIRAIYDLIVNNQFELNEQDRLTIIRNLTEKLEWRSTDAP